eukprot:4668362-Alexandrium_andersonii.AAC.1
MPKPRSAADFDSRPTAGETVLDEDDDDLDMEEGVDFDSCKPFGEDGLPELTEHEREAAGLGPPPSRAESASVGKKRRVHALSQGVKRAASPAAAKGECTSGDIIKVGGEDSKVLDFGGNGDCGYRVIACMNLVLKGQKAIPALLQPE